MKRVSTIRQRAFTLLETVIAIGVLSVLLTGFILVFAPAAAGIKKAIDVQEADRLASTLQKELVTLRQGQERDGNEFTTGFDKAFEYIRDSDDSSNAILIYKYRGKLGASTRADGTPEPEPDVKHNVPGQDYVVQTMVRARDDNNFERDLEALEGPVYLVKCTQLVFDSGELKPGTPGQISDPKGQGGNYSDSDDYPEAMIAFVADFYALAGRNAAYFKTESFTNIFNNGTPVFSRNLAVRR